MYAFFYILNMVLKNLDYTNISVSWAVVHLGTTKIVDSVLSVKNYNNCYIQLSYAEYIINNKKIATDLFTSNTIWAQRMRCLYSSL